jgi:hypothetical protein
VIKFFNKVNGVNNFMSSPRISDAEPGVLNHSMSKHYVREVEFENRTREELSGISDYRYGRQALWGEQGNCASVDREGGPGSLQASRGSKPDT